MHISRREFGVLSAAALAFRAQRANAGQRDVFVFGQDLPANLDPQQILDLGMTSYALMEPKDYEVMTDLVMKYIARDTDKRPAVADMMTNRLVGGLKLTPAEWEQTQKNAQEFRPYVS